MLNIEKELKKNLILLSKKFEFRIGKQIVISNLEFQILKYQYRVAYEVQRSLELPKLFSKK